MIGTGQLRAAQGKREPADEPTPLIAALKAEFAILHPGCKPPAGDRLTDFFAAVHDMTYERAALCLSGGGIRSACFALGVLQELARHRLLGRFHYLSMVSGGGYVGAWLSAWRHHAQNDPAVFESLAARRAQAPGAEAADPFAEPAELEGLRQNSNFLTPKLGMTSADTWTVAALCGRNLLLNWTIFGPLLLALVLVPQAASLFLGWAHSWPDWAHVLLISCAAVALFLALLVTTANRPLNRPSAASGSGKLPAPFGTGPVGPRLFYMWILLPTYLAAMLFAIFAVGHVHAGDHRAPWVIFGGAALGAITYAASWLVARHLGRQPAKPRRRFFERGQSDLSPAMEFAWSAVSGAAAGVMIGVGVELYRVVTSDQWEWETLATFGIGWVMSALLIADLLFTGLTSYARNGDFDREWSARSSGHLGVAGLIWLLFAGVVLFGPVIFGIGRPNINQPFASLGQFSNGIVALAGGFSGFVTMALGRSAGTAAEAAGKWMEKLTLTRILGLATVIFILCLTVLLSAVTSSTLLYLEFHLGMMAPGEKLLITALAAVICLCIGAGASYFVNVNRFSLHDIYRNRLIRAFLGSARASLARRHPQSTDPFTGFSRRDNLPISCLRESIQPGTPGRLFPVVNVALNLVGGTNLAWQERKAESFTINPLYCGNPAVGYRRSDEYGSPRGGITLGTAMAISGAAASPNQGYHSSPIVGLIMMLFNVRLGWWLGNPAKAAKIWRRDGPRWSFLPVIREMFGRTNNQTDWIYLSDGGHFDNLGLYEMVRRRCRFILISDAGCDPDCAFQDLGSALRKIWIDFGVQIEFDSLDIRARAMPPAKAVYCGLARIIYPEAPERPGHLIYLKPGYYGNEPADVRAYALTSPKFPHEATADQWFTESQMESYRGLGAYIVQQICRPACGDGVPETPRAPSDLNELLQRVRASLSVNGVEAAGMGDAGRPEPTPLQPAAGARMV